MTVLKVTTDGDPFPALAGGSNLDGSGLPKNIGSRLFSGGAVIADQDKTYSIDYRGGQGGILQNNADNTGYIGADLVDSSPHDVYINDEGLFELNAIGVMANGVALFPPGVQQDNNGTSSGLRTFNVPELLVSQYPTDACGGRPEANGEYRYRSGAFYLNGWNNVSKLKQSSAYFNLEKPFNEPFFGDFLRHAGGIFDNKNFTSGHSKILGFAFDGFPIYGPYGYASPFNSASAVVKMRSSYVKRNINDETENRKSLGNTYSMGNFIEDYSYNASKHANNSGAFLDEHNGRFCITPDYKKGTYAYFITLDELDEPEYPYVIGPTTKERRSL
jgi:hypothetical protein